MKYDFSKVLKNVKGQPMMAEEGGTTPWTALTALQNAVLSDTAENAGNKLKRYRLFQKLNAHIDTTLAVMPGDGASISTDYTAEEIVLLNTAVLSYPTLFAGQLTDILDQA